MSIVGQREILTQRRVVEFFRNARGYAYRTNTGRERCPRMSQHEAASGQLDRAANPADGVGGLNQGPGTHPVAWCIRVPTGTAKMEIPGV